MTAGGIAAEVIRRKRDGALLSDEAIGTLVASSLRSWSGMTWATGCLSVPVTCRWTTRLANRFVAWSKRPTGAGPTAGRRARMS